jgi:transposase
VETFYKPGRAIAAEETMAKEQVSEALWEAIAPLLPEPKPSPKGGRPPVPDRACLAGIVSVLKTGMPWQLLPTRLGYGSGSTCRRRFHAWTRLGVWPELHRHLLRALGRRGRINLERAVIDSASVRALRRAVSESIPARAFPVRPGRGRLWAIAHRLVGRQGHPHG